MRSCIQRIKRSAHPRTRGELRLVRWRHTRDPGSSPHTRGTLDLLKEKSVFLRLIPAHAGNSTTGSGFIGLITAHPRTRGELCAGQQDPQGLAGSSPHTRGTQFNKIALQNRARLIPAHAGNSTEALLLLITNAAHPRTRGELRATCF